MTSNANVYRRAREARAFTLVELLVVVSIIAVLMAILLPSMRRARDQARRVKCFANLHAIHIGLICYADDNRQELPSYSTMGGWGFRVAPGRIVPSKNAPPGTGYPEAYGLQAVLHNGTAPKIRPGPGLAEYVTMSPVYVPGDSDVWVCPANQGPQDRETDWKGYGNTYYYRTNSGGSDDFAQPGDPDYASTPKKNYNIDWLNRNAKMGALNLLVNDNYIYYPAPSGFGRPDRKSDYTVPEARRRAPHRVFGMKKNISQFWCANYADGHCQMNGWNDNN